MFITGLNKSIKSLRSFETLVQKLILYPLAFFAIYCTVIVLGERVVSKVVNYEMYSILILTVIFVTASAIAFGLTIVFHLITTRWCTGFRSWFHYSHLILGYISGLITALITIEPPMIRELGTGKMPEECLVAVLILFLAISNYSLYKTIVLDDKFEIKENAKKSLKSILVSVKKIHAD